MSISPVLTCLISTTGFAVWLGIKNNMFDHMLNYVAYIIRLVFKIFAETHSKYMTASLKIVSHCPCLCNLTTKSKFLSLSHFF